MMNLMAYVNKADRLKVPLGPQYGKIRQEIARAPDIVKLLLGMNCDGEPRE